MRSWLINESGRQRSDRKSRKRKRVPRYRRQQLRMEMLEDRRVLAGPGPEVLSIVRADANPTNANSVAFTVTFDEAVTGVDASDFIVDANGPTLASVEPVSGSGAVYTVNVTTGSGDGSLSLDLIDDDSIVRVSGNGKSLKGNQDGSFTTGEIYTIDKSAPVANSISLIGTPTASAATIEYNVTFSESVNGVDQNDFSVIANGVTGAGVKQRTIN